jgi:hypothetical protein
MKMPHNIYRQQYVMNSQLRLVTSVLISSGSLWIVLTSLQRLNAIFICSCEFKAPFCFSYCLLNRRKQVLLRVVMCMEPETM